MDLRMAVEMAQTDFSSPFWNAVDARPANDRINARDGGVAGGLMPALTRSCNGPNERSASKLHASSAKSTSHVPNLRV